MLFLDHLEPLTKSYGVFSNSKSALAWAFRTSLSIDLSNDMLIKAGCRAGSGDAGPALAFVRL